MINIKNKMNPLQVKNTTVLLTESKNYELNLNNTFD